jgi:uncharacterized membrane protein
MVDRLKMKRTNFRKVANMPEIIPNLHPAAVHLPIALTLVACLFSVVARIFPFSSLSLRWFEVGHWTLWLAALTGIIAAFLGWQAYNSVNHDDAGHLAMTLHRNWALPTAFGLVLLAIWDGWRYGRGQAVMPWLRIGLLFVLCLAIIRTAWLGGEVVYRHGIGVIALPAQEALPIESGSSNQTLKTDESDAHMHDHTKNHDHAQHQHQH